MLIFIHLILNIFICSLHSITTNVYGGEGPSNNNLKQLESTYNENGQMLTITRNKRYLDGGLGDGGGDFAAPAPACVSCGKGFCDNGYCKCIPCPRPKPKNRLRRPQIKRKSSRRPRPRPYIRRPYW
uniref:Secreted protein n=1 Tax=Meloidogyne javanica TaxID=6303 RepID=A0A915LSE2_MELJA